MALRKLPHPSSDDSARRARLGMRQGIRLGRIAGIEVVADWSLLIIFLLITFSLAGGVFPSWHPDWGVGLAWSTALGAAVLFFASLLAHELSQEN